ncbi:MAG: type II toxin-antitoxin system RelE/ParE family toxin [Verrucomicrobia bacterium]|nr:type II toxin-antitoxin system RelE/ParE family toxin [Verrucomicrobiota bacterium]
MKIVYHTSVQKDLNDAWRYYESASEGLGGQFFDEFLDVVASIQRNPKHWPPTTKGRRVALFRRFPYKLLYRAQAEQIKVLVVRHQKRSPAFGDKRK